MITGELTVLPKHWWEGTDAQGRSATSPRARWSRRSARAPTGSRNSSPADRSCSNASRITGARTCRSHIGQNNFDELRYEYFRDDTVAREALKADGLDWFKSAAPRNGRRPTISPRCARIGCSRNSSRSAIGRMQGLVLNLRRPQFADARLRRAFNYAFDFEEMNRVLSTGVPARYQLFRRHPRSAWRPACRRARSSSSSRPLRDKVPPEVFTTPYTNPVGGKPENVRANLREATRLLKEAGFEIRDRKLVDSSGQPFTVEILGSDQRRRADHAVLQAVLERLGITVNLRTVDAVQYQNRVRNFDFEMITEVWGQSLSPGNEQREISVRRLPTVRARTIFPASRIRPSMPSSSASSSPTAAPIWSPPARRWIGSCSGTSTGSAIHLRFAALCPLGSLQPSRSVAEIRGFRIPDSLVVRRRQGSQAQAFMSGSAHGAFLSVGTHSASASVRWGAVLRPAPAAADNAEPRCTACRCSAT